MSDRLESAIKKAIMDYLATRPNTFAFRVSTTGIPDTSLPGGFRKNLMVGVSDIIGVKNGKFFALEVKTRDGKLTEHQERFLKRVDKAGGYGAVVRCVEDAVQCWGEI